MQEARDLTDLSTIQSVFGNQDKNIKRIEALLPVRIRTQQDRVIIEGDEEEAVHAAERVLEALSSLSRTGWDIDPSLTQYAVLLDKEGRLGDVISLGREVIAVNHRGRPIHSKTLGQSLYVRAIHENTLTFGIGPAGTGKTYLAVAAAVSALKAREVERLILTRPAVEAGEKLGFLPGDLAQKVDPYLRPLYDALTDILGMEACQRLQERGIIEVAPLAYMRGRTLSDSFIILDEAQNTTREQMKMFLTRLGFRSRIVVTGDPSQIDLPRGRVSGLTDAVEILQGLDQIAIIELTTLDVVRHELIQAIVNAYAAHEKEEKESGYGE